MRTAMSGLLCLMLFLFIPLPVLAIDAEQAANTPCLPCALATDAEQHTNASWWERFRDRVVQTWESPTYDVYLPLYTWHNRLAYDSSKAAKYNEAPWGGGIGKSMIDKDGDWHALYAMGFQDSHNMFEPIVGYGFQKNLRPGKSDDWRIGGGFTVGVTARQQYRYVPIPLPLPMAGIEYKRMALQAVYIPGGRNDGNVLFCWLRWQVN